jgi:predicted RNA-binding Zn-ribbon protein involved in translation (DUF1610 family)
MGDKGVLLMVTEVKSKLTIWVCPSCGNYYGSSSAGDLAVIEVPIRVNGKSLKRSVCPDCGDDRVPCRFEVTLTPKDEADKTDGPDQGDSDASQAEG